MALSLKDFGGSRVWGGEEGGNGKEMRSILLADTYLKIKRSRSGTTAVCGMLRRDGSSASVQGQQSSAQLSASASTSGPPAATSPPEARFKENQVEKRH